METDGSERLTPLQRQRERSVLFVLLADVLSTICFTVTGLLGGSLTIIAEMLRAWGVLSAGIFSYIVLRRLHRGSLQDLEYGSGKLEQLVNVVIGTVMIPAAAWVAWNAFAMIAGLRGIATPLGLAGGAITGMINCYMNLLSWDGVRRAAAGERSILMGGFVTMRLVKLLASAFLAVTLAVCALSTDREVIAWTDAIGGMFVAVFIFWGALQILRQALPDLLDRSAGREVRTKISQCLAQHRALYARVGSIRSRRSGRTVFVEIALAFASELTVADVQTRIDAIRSHLQNTIADSDIALLTVSADAVGR